MAMYRVVWEIDLDADTPLEAAGMANRLMQEGDLTVFRVAEIDDDMAESVCPDWETFDPVEDSYIDAAERYVEAIQL
jgi:hypothetical protein